jgi:hypothetical protein
MRFIKTDKIIESQKISHNAIEKILSTVKLEDTTINFELMCNNNKDKLYLEDITLYDDLINTMDNDKKSQFYILKNNNKTQAICFQARTDRVQNRTLKQKLADISTSYLISQFNDDTFSEFFKSFYVPIDAFIKTYGKMHNLRIPEDLCFFYKGGNLFRILLGDISKIMESKEYISLLKRSDADFQLFINPQLKNKEQIFKDLSIIVIYNLLLFKKTIFNKGLFDFFKIKPHELCKLYSEVFESYNIKLKNIEIIDNIYRSDFSIEPITYNDEKMVLFKEHKTLIQNVPKLKISKEFFISRNTALNFTRKDNLKSVFDLIRMKRNIQIKITTETNEVKYISVPCEIIDVSIPKDDDYSLHSTKNTINKYVRQYIFQSKSFNFWAPNINYMIKDLNDVLFKQSDYPWSDPKIDKRAIRYFISLLFHQIMRGILDKQDIVINLNNFKKELKGTINFLECYTDKSSCEIDNNYMSRLMANKYDKLSKKINNIKDIKLRAEEINKFNNFNRKIVIILKNLIKEIDNLISNSSKINKTKMNNIYNKLIISHITSALGG